MNEHWLPFMTGARGCIGQAFATMEMRVVLSKLVPGFDLSLAPEQPEPKVVQRLLLLPSSVHLRCTPR